ncbi:MAG TPA: LuxR family transcriptional regulator [Chromatiaceae bacterium]|nr:LuxR family transcriptional regulator [Chromatiaceae bacterium]
MNTTAQSADILVVDDNPDMIHLLSKLLTDRGHRVRAAKESGLALKIAQSSPPELFLLDINMPGMDGYSLCGELKKFEALADIPVIFVSGYEEQENKIKAFDAGGVDYICKPIHSEELLSRVNTHVELFRLRKQLQEQVAEKTRELAETLTALRVLMTQQQQDSKETEKNILNNINSLVIPFAERLQKTTLTENQQSIVDMLIANLKQVSESLINNHDLLQMKLTPVEIQVANLIREGKQTKEIASLLNLSDLTISTHRKNIRKKLNIKDRKLSLNAFLSSL